VTGSRPAEGCEAFAVAEVTVGAASGLAVRGEVELVTAPALTVALDEAIRGSSGPFIVDLSTVDFLDSSGIHCLVRARALLGRDDRPIMLVCPRSNVRRVLALAGLDELVPLYASREELARVLADPPTSSRRHPPSMRPDSG
jgi:anti-sigma B factor antagonist